ncbi:MAG: RnfABCDGE type electron transport complex subunit D [Granulosicoccus sp.]
MSQLDLSLANLPQRSVRAIMLQVMLALIPGTVLYAILINPVVLINITSAILIAMLLEATAVALRRRPVKSVLSDGTVVLAAWLLALSVPPMLPLWQLMIGVLAMVLLGKQLYGGLGNNPFNPAMVGYAVLMVSFPVTMTGWLSPVSGWTQALPELSLTDLISIKTTLAGLADSELAPHWDALTRATPLTDIRTQSARDSVALANERRYDNLVFISLWPWISIAWLCGGLYLLLRKIISWHIPLSVLLSLALLHALQDFGSASAQLAVAPAVLSGAAILGAFFIATDPVTAATSQRGRLIYGAGIGTLMFVIREFSAYPEGLAFAILIMNAAVPTIDRLVMPRCSNRL